MEAGFKAVQEASTKALEDTDAYLNIQRQHRVDFDQIQASEFNREHARFYKRRNPKQDSWDEKAKSRERQLSPQSLAVSL